MDVYHVPGGILGIRIRAMNLQAFKAPPGAMTGYLPWAARTAVIGEGFVESRRTETLQSLSVPSGRQRGDQEQERRKLTLRNQDKYKACRKGGGGEAGRWDRATS